ncbi:hypothetical protein [Actinoplanes sp. NPDC049118]|uniref:hypothetical protein n=1 Tax=Actinoplanes sp. NPDC049118 TaxID=3155769 RepID=UPI0033DED3EC
MAVDTSPSLNPPGRRWWSVLRAVLLAMWLLASAASWWSAPRPASYAEAKAAVAEKRLTAYQWGDSWDTQVSHLIWFDGAELTSTGTIGPLFVWRTGDGRVRWTDTEKFDEVTVNGAVAENDYSGPGATGLAQDLVAAGVADRTGAVDTTGPWLAGAGLVLALLVLGVIVAGPAPVLGTRWFWFWLTLTAPYGLGLVFWLLRDRPWSRTARPALGADGRQRRDRGFLGLLIGILASLLVSALVLVLNMALGDWWVPSGTSPY